MTRTDWTREEIADLFDLPFDELMFQAQTVHRAHHAAGEVQLCTLLSIKTGGCPEDCAAIARRPRVTTNSGVKADQADGASTRCCSDGACRPRPAAASRFCMGAAWREPKDRDLRRGLPRWSKGVQGSWDWRPASRSAC